MAVAETSLAEPVAVVNNGPTAAAKIKKLTQDYGAKTIVVGVSEGAMAQKSREFGRRLKDLGLKVDFHDETLSSHEALEKLRHKRLGFRQQPQDAYQAAVMLQDWLDGQ